MSGAAGPGSGVANVSPGPDDDKGARETAAGPQAPADVQGYVDGLNPKWNVVGWARSRIDTRARVKVELAEAGATVASDIAERFRGDLLEAGIGDGNHGFQLAIPASLFDGRRHNLTVRALRRGGVAEQVGQLSVTLPSRLPGSGSTAGSHAGEAARLVANVIASKADGGMAAGRQGLETYAEALTEALAHVAREYDAATALSLLYIHVLRRRIDETGLQTRLTRLSENMEEFGSVVKEIVLSDEARSILRNDNGRGLPDLDAIQIWTKLRSGTD